MPDEEIFSYYLKIFNDAIDALNKSKVVPSVNPLGDYVCKCARVVGELDNYCPECGRKLDWDNVEYND